MISPIRKRPGVSDGETSEVHRTAFGRSLFAKLEEVGISLVNRTRTYGSMNTANGNFTSAISLYIRTYGEIRLYYTKQCKNTWSLQTNVNILENFKHPFDQKRFVLLIVACFLYCKALRPFITEKPPPR